MSAVHVESDQKTADRALQAALAAPRIVIERIAPWVEGGCFPGKAIVGQWLSVSADIFMDGHDTLAAELVWRDAGGESQRMPMRALGNDRWQTEIQPATPGLHRFNLEAWLDVWASYRSALKKKVAAGTAAPGDLAEGRGLIERAAQRCGGEPQKALRSLLARLQRARNAHEVLLAADTAEVMSAVDERPHLRRLSADVLVEVERVRAGFASWYELFPRSQTAEAAREAPGASAGGDKAFSRTLAHGTFDDVIARLPAIREMGFDVLYFPPIHPIGRTHRKGRNNALTAQPEDPGSVYAIGDAGGGHEAVHPELGGLPAFRRLLKAAHAEGMEIALDFAVQCSPDHPWLKQHPGWFAWRPDGSLRYAENPPKKYEDIVNPDFHAADAQPALWLALRDVVQKWVDEGVKIFRVDNPHTKPLPFWQWLIADIRGRHPEVIFLSEAFTRPAMMYRLAKIGFSQSYTYFTWRNTKRELTDYLTELTQGPPQDFFRPNFFVNTPDINPPFLQTSGRPGFVIRAALAATLSGLWGLYSGFELCEAEALPGKEEYLDSEKYQIKPRDWQAPGNIVREITQLNRIRRENPALHSHLGLKFYQADNDQVLYFGKATRDRSNFILVAVSLDPLRMQETRFEAPLWEFGLPDHGVLHVEELMSGTRFNWFGKLQHWRFVPAEMPVAIWRVSPA